MNGGYTKLFSDIITSSIWNEDDKTRIVWITLLALSNAHGRVHCALPSLAIMSRVKDDECEKAIKKLESPDRHSRTDTHEGRRIEKTEGGWLIINYEKHRNRLSENPENVALRERVKRHRDKIKSNEDRKGARFTKPTPEQIAEYSASIEYPLDGEAWCDSYEQKGWMVGKSRMKDWKAAVRNWKRNGWKPVENKQEDDRLSVSRFYKGDKNNGKEMV